MARSAGGAQRASPIGRSNQELLLTRNRPRLTTPAAPLAQRPLLFQEGSWLGPAFPSD